MYTQKNIRYNDGVNSYCKGNGGFGCPYFKDRSKFVEQPTVFLTREEAEKALEERERE